MISSLKSKLIPLLVAAVLLIGAFAFLTHHPMSMNNEDGHSDCDITCQIACFNQAVSNVVAIPTHFDAYTYVLPLVSLAFGLLLIGHYRTQSDTFRYNLGPPLYKVFETYRY